MAKKEKNEVSSIEEAKKQRAALHKERAAKKLTDSQKREAFRLYWAQEKYQFGKAKDLEDILWLHLKAVKMDEPDKFEAGIAHFGLKKVN